MYPAASDLMPLLVSPLPDGTYPNRTHYATLGEGTSATCLLTAAETGGAFSLFVVTLLPGAGVPTHIHQNEDEAFSVLEGSLTIQVGEEWQSVGKGGNAWGPRGVPHAIHNTGDTPVRMLIASVPGGFEAFFADLNAFGPRPGESQDSMIGRMIALMGSHGMTPAAPAPGMENPRIVGPGTGDFLELGDHRCYLRVGSQNTKGAFFWADMEVDAHGGVPPHVHELEDETFYIVSGKFAFEVGGSYFEVGPGEVVFGPRGIAHAWQCLSDNGGRVELIITPGANFEAFARTMDSRQYFPARDMADPALAAQLMALTVQHSLRMLPPSIK